MIQLPPPPPHLSHLQETRKKKGCLLTPEDIASVFLSLFLLFSFSSVIIPPLSHLGHIAARNKHTYVFLYISFFQVWREMRKQIRPLSCTKQMTHRRNCYTICFNLAVSKLLVVYCNGCRDAASKELLHNFATKK